MNAMAGQLVMDRCLVDLPPCLVYNCCAVAQRMLRGCWTRTKAFRVEGSSAWRTCLGRDEICMVATVSSYGKGIMDGVADVVISAQSYDPVREGLARGWRSRCGGTRATDDQRCLNRPDGFCSAPHCLYFLLVFMFFFVFFLSSASA